ncbi:unnamed protein product [Mytilus edulis]|uniref:Uncharacterized protein n=1 Tax=Mytilus edulis TaxID=6550 RepID=A0A8S3QQE0_MYTED|nr:unnamed protein product [Mytilus edulis]
MDGNKLESLPVGIFKILKTLAKLSIAENPIKSIEVGIFDNNLQLQEMEVSTRLPSLPGQLLEDMKPTMLHFGSNLLQKLPDGFFKEQTRLLTLYLDYNSLTDLDPDLFTSLTKLEVLYLDYNSLTDLDPDLLTSLTKLEVLYADANKIVSIPDPELLFKYNNKMLVYNLQENSMICDCSAKNVYFFAKRVLAENNCILTADCSHVSGRKTSLCGLEKSFFDGCVDVTNNNTSSESTTTLIHIEEEHESETGRKHCPLWLNDEYVLFVLMITKTIISKFLCKDETHDTTSADITTETTDETAEHEEENESETGFTATATFAAAGAVASTLAVYGLSKTMLKRINTSSVSPHKGFGGDNSDREDTLNKNKSTTNTAINGADKEKKSNNQMSIPMDDDVSNIGLFVN